MRKFSLKKRLGRSWTYFWLYSHSSVGNCQVGLRRTLISEFLLPCQAVLEWETLGFPDSRFQSRVSWGLKSEAGLAPSSVAGILQVCPGSALAAVASQEIHSSWNGAAALRAAQGVSCQPEGLRESWASFALEKTVVTSTPCGFCPEQDISVLAALHPIRLPRETPRAVAARSSILHCEKVNCFISVFPLCIFLKQSFCSKK